MDVDRGLRHPDRNRRHLDRARSRESHRPRGNRGWDRPPRPTGSHLGRPRCRGTLFGRGRNGASRSHAARRSRHPRCASLGPSDRSRRARRMDRARTHRRVIFVIGLDEGAGDMTAEKKGRPSDPPVPELKKERDAFIQTFFQKGAQFTQELVNENSRLRHRLGELEQDKRALLSRYEEAEAASSRWLDQYAEVEGELANFANLYVASYQLHASLSFRTTVRQIKELLEQLVGARVFAVYLSTSDGRKLVPVVGEGVGSPRAIPVNPDDDGIGEVFSTGVARVERGDLRAGSLDNPIALVPIKMEDKVVGVFAIYATLEQKSQFLPVDFELFKLLGAHAAEALVCARLFDDAGHRLPSFDSFFDSHM